MRAGGGLGDRAGQSRTSELVFRELRKPAAPQIDNLRDLI
jgi:hypothetical protein